MTEKIKWLLWQRQRQADRDLPHYEIVRRENMLRYGFGPEVMKQIKICGTCGTQNAAYERKCRECRAKLPHNTLFDLYREMHQSCPICKTVIPDDTGYCPICGKKLTTTKFETEEKKMKKLLSLLLTLALIFSLAACGGGGDDKTPSSDDKTPSNSQQQEDKTPEADPVEDEPDDKGGNETDADGWPVADYITAGMKYKGAGKIVNASTWKEDDTIVVWRVYFDAASVDEVAAYIDALKAEGFTYWPLFDDEEEQAAGTFSTFGYEWQAEIANGPYVEIQHYEEPTDEFSGVDLAQLKIVLYSENPNA